MTFFEIKQQFATALAPLYPPQEVAAMLKLLVENCRISYTEMLMTPQAEIVPEHEKCLQEALQRLLAQEPIQYILGKADFYGLQFSVSPAVLIPRGETEELVQRAICIAQSIERPVIVDACTGSACIAIALAKHLPQARLCACDISFDALSVAKRNAQQNNVNVNFVHCDILKPSEWKKLPLCNLLVSNPPYVMESEKSLMQQNVLAYEPEIALFVSNDNPLVFYHALAQLGQCMLQAGGILLCEINENLAEETAQLFTDYDYKNVEILRDIHERERFVICQWKLC
ncbi:MAG: peptide chain release factor N(5)-glutamine methyltransferase [Bacteroidales bacterium]|jgi:release factor glutamine methyltransferase|nr:peptide chain release factor N(5)-glutamine methyltransferase [Bacteroidales bacterium]